MSKLRPPRQQPENKGVLVLFYGDEVTALNAACKHLGMRKTVTPHDLTMQEVVHRWILDPKSPKKTGDYSGWEPDEIEAMDRISDIVLSNPLR